MNIIDQYHGDPAYAHLHVLTRNRPEARAMLKTAAFETTKEALDRLPSTAFAWSDERRLPIHTREDALASILYRTKLGSAVPEHVDQKLANAAIIFGLKKSLFTDVKEAAAPVEPTYALPEEQRLPLDSAEQIKQAEFVLARDYSRLPLEKRAEAFMRLTKASKEHSVALSPLTQKMAGLTVSHTKTLCDWLEARASVSSDEKHAAAFDKLASVLSTQPTFITNRNELIKLASTISTLDKKAGLERHYDRKLPDPIQTVFNTTKTAGLTCDVAGTPMDCAQLMALPPEIWEQVDMPELAEIAASGDEATFKQVFDTAPMDIKMVLSRQING